MPSTPLHDPCAVAFVLNPTLFETKLIRVEIETQSNLTSGLTVCDFYGHFKGLPNCLICTKLDVPKFWDLMLEALTKANHHSPLNQMTQSIKSHEISSVIRAKL